MRAALATTDGKVINTHFGKCGVFHIVEIDAEEKQWHFVEHREVAPACKVGEHDSAAFSKLVGQLSDCGVVFVSRIGLYGRAALERESLQVLELTGPVDDVLEGYIAYLEKKRQREKARAKAAYINGEECGTAPFQASAPLEQL